MTLWMTMTTTRWGRAFGLHLGAGPPRELECVDAWHPLGQLAGGAHCSHATRCPISSLACSRHSLVVRCLPAMLDRLWHGLTAAVE